MLRADRSPHAARSAVLLVVLAVSAAFAHASTPRWVTGPPYFTGAAGVAVVWYTSNPLYFTDPGDLSASVNHAAADAMVAAAAGAWNVPTSALTIAQGGALAEHVSGANSYLGSTGPVFPADVQSANYAAIQIAVIYDSDGSVTDMLLGGGASTPAECRWNAVTESVDSIVPAGYIQHAILVLNGRCTGPVPEQQLQMQYQLERAFGRILGVGWSQTNENVFSDTPQPTYGQALHWPIMHPIDIVCGPYTYQCLPLPFTLRDDDIAAITSLYPLISQSNPLAPPSGKVWSYQQASVVDGILAFPTGQGMQGVNIELQRLQGGFATLETWADVSAVSGFAFQQNAGNPVIPPLAPIAASMGAADLSMEGYFRFAWVPDIVPPGTANGPMSAVLTTEAINPLYIGEYSVGPYVLGSVSPSGSRQTQELANTLVPFLSPNSSVEAAFPPNNATSSCNTAGDGTESAPLPVAMTGWWAGVLCPHGHSAWSRFSAHAGRTATLEVTALDEAGFATTAKLMPLIGAWAAVEPGGILPTVAASRSAFNTVTLGMTAIGVDLFDATSLRFVIADQRGAGRPDFAYQARVLYADAIQPSVVGAIGGLVAISGMGFRAGNEVMVGGVPATVVSWTANTIIAAAPPQSVFGSTPSVAVDVAVTDLSTRGSTVMSSALTYGSFAPDVVTLVSAPSGTVLVGTTASTPFVVRVFLSDGITPAVGMPVAFSAAAGNAQFAACSVSPCVVLTDPTGTASSAITPTSFGAVTLQATAVGVAVSVSFNAIAVAIAPLRPTQYIAAGATVPWNPQVSVAENGAPAAGIAVSWTGAGISPASSFTNALGVAQTTATTGSLASGAQITNQACVFATVCTSFISFAVDPSLWRILIVSGAGQILPFGSTFAPAVLMVTDANGNPVGGAPVVIHQTISAAEMPCPAQGPCPIAPTLVASTAAALSDANGLVSITPLELAATAGVTNIAAATGTQGFVAFSLSLSVH